MNKDNKFVPNGSVAYGEADFPKGALMVPDSPGMVKYGFKALMTSFKEGKGQR